MFAVLAIWGIIGYKIISALNPEAPKSSPQEMVVNFKPQITKEKDTFSIQDLDRDPFLGTIHKKTTTASIIRPINTQTEWPQVIYGGLVKKQNTNTQIFVVNINSKQYLLKKGQSVDDITLLKGNPNEIVLLYKNHQKTITIQK